MKARTFGLIFMDKVTYISKKYNIRCSHQLQICTDDNLNKSKENSLHGHHMDVIITVKGITDKTTGLVSSRDLIDKVAQEFIIKKYDKMLLNKIMELPTGENLVQAMTDDLLASPIKHLLHQVQLKETNKNFFTGPTCNE